MKAINLLKTEWLKFKSNAVVSLLMMMYLIFFPAVIFIGKEFKNVPPPLPNNSIFFEFPSMWSYLGYVGNWMVFFFIGLMVIFMITQEVGYKTMRQNIINGYTRKDFFLAKVLSTLALAIGATVLYAVVGLAIGFFHTEGADLSFALDNSYAIPRFFLMTMGYSSIAFIIAFLIRKSGVAVMFYLSYIILIEHLLKWIIHFQVMGIKNNSVNFYPSNAVEDLMPNPLFKYAENIPRKDLTFDFLLSYESAAITSSVYIVLFFGLAYYLFTQRDI